MKIILFITTFFMLNLSLAQDNLKDFNQVIITQGDVKTTLYLREGQRYELKDNQNYIYGNDFIVKVEIIGYDKKSVLISYPNHFLTSTNQNWLFHYKSDEPKNTLYFELKYFNFFGKLKLIERVEFVCTIDE